VTDHVDALALTPVFHEPPPVDPSYLARRVSPARPTAAPEEGA